MYDARPEGRAEKTPYEKKKAISEKNFENEVPWAFFAKNVLFFLLMNWLKVLPESIRNIWRAFQSFLNPLNPCLRMVYRLFVPIDSKTFFTSLRDLEGGWGTGVVTGVVDTNVSKKWISWQKGFRAAKMFPNNPKMLRIDSDRTFHQYINNKMEHFWQKNVQETSFWSFFIFF